MACSPKKNVDGTSPKGKINLDCVLCRKAMMAFVYKARTTASISARYSDCLRPGSGSHTPS
eukprot:1344885-Amphidinium_carterae.1